MWEPALAVALSIFLTITLFLTIYGFAYLGIVMMIKTVKSIKKQIIKE